MQIFQLLLQKLVIDFNGGPVGVETIASILGEDKETVEEVYEPFLIRKGYLEKTPRGRKIAPLMHARLKQKYLSQGTLI